MKKDWLLWMTKIEILWQGQCLTDVVIISRQNSNFLIQFWISNASLNIARSNYFHIFIYKERNRQNIMIVTLHNCVFSWNYFLCYLCFQPFDQTCQVIYLLLSSASLAFYVLWVLNSPKLSSSFYASNISTVFFFWHL